VFAIIFEITNVFVVENVFLDVNINVDHHEGEGRKTSCASVAVVLYARCRNWLIGLK